MQFLGFYHWIKAQEMHFRGAAYYKPRTWQLLSIPYEGRKAEKKCVVSFNEILLREKNKHLENMIQNFILGTNK